MIVLLIPFMVLAGIGFSISLAVHLLALSGHLPPGGEAVFALHIGVFVVWLPAVLVSIRLRQGSRSRFSWSQTLSGCPAWMRYAGMALFGYAFLNFFLAMGQQPPSRIHAKELSPEILRAFSGHWMLFYGMAFCILFSAFRKPWLLTTVECPSGHKVAHADSFCPTCGVAIPSRGERA
jgi:hypothetical protein